MKIGKVVKSPSLREQAYQSLRNALVSGRLQPGSRLTEEGIAEFLGVSRTPAREALSTLHQEGAIERRSSGGFRVPVPSLEKLEQIFEVRRLLEPYAIRLVAARVTPEDIERLRAGTAAQRTAIGNPDIAEFTQANRESRNRFFQLCGNDQLIDCIARYNDHLQFVASLTLPDPNVQKIVVDGYDRIIDALAIGNAEAADAAMRLHIEAAHTALTKRLA